LTNPLVITTSGGVVSGDESTKKPAEAAQPFDSAIFAAEKAAWEALNISDYQFVIRDYVPAPWELSAPATITVLSNTVTNIEWGNEQEKPYLHYGQTIDAMYASIADEVARTTDRAFLITYNATYHYPEYFDSYPAPPEGMFISPGDGPYWFEISSFDVLD
jgi:hypothetical protein